ncbi:MAG: hypothetical protein WA194_03555 [Patescibacteria group bacterium]
MKAHQLKTLAAFTSLAVALSAVVQPVSALTVPEAITSIQTSNPTLPTGVANPKGNIGFLLANMFWNSSDVGYDSSKFGKIKPTYFDGAGFTAWTNTLSGTYLTNASENVGIGTSNPQAKLHVEGKVKAGVFSSKQGAPDAIDDSTNGFSFGTDGDT